MTFWFRTLHTAYTLRLCAFSTQCSMLGARSETLPGNVNYFAYGVTNGKMVIQCTDSCLNPRLELGKTQAVLKHGL